METYDDYNGEDIGGYLADADYLADIDYDEELKHRRKKLSGKYILTCISPKNGDTLYYQDRSINKKGFWSTEFSTAFGFFSEITANAYCKRLRYNKPKVQFVEPNTLKLKDVPCPVWKPKSITP